MRITPEEARRRLNSSGNLSQLASLSPSVLPAPVIEHKVKDRPFKSRQLSEETRDTMADMVASGTKGKVVAGIFGVSNGAVSNAVTGRSSSKPPTAERAVKVLDRQLHIKDVALTKLMQSLNLIGDENLSELGAKDLSAVASNMSKVVHSLSVGETGASPVNIVVYAPEMRSEEKFKVIDV